jgi:hypothetical protein
MTKRTRSRGPKTANIPGPDVSPGRRRMAQSVLAWSGPEHPDLDDEEVHDLTFGTYCEPYVDELRKEVHIGFTEALFARMRDYGGGPFRIGAPGAKRLVLDQWFAHGFYLWPHEKETIKRYTPLPPSAPGQEHRPRWLLAAGADGQAERLEEMLALAGAEVIPINDQVRAAQLVTHERLDGLLMRFNMRLDAEFCIADICMRRGIPFGIITNVVERPRSMSLGGVVVHNPRSVREVIAALASLPPEKRKGLTLPPPDPDLSQKRNDVGDDAT